MEVYGGLSWPKICKEISNRVGAALLAHLQGDNTHQLKAYPNLCKSFTNPRFFLCLRKSNSGCGGAPSCTQRYKPSPTIKVRTTDPEMVLALAKVTLQYAFVAEALTATLYYICLIIV